MTKKTADSFISTNQEYVKLRNSQAPGVDNTPREQPKGQIPGYRGHDKPAYAQWTDKELVELAKTLDLDVHEDIEREDLLKLIIKKETP